MKKIATTGFLLIVLGVIFIYRTDIVTLYVNTFLNANKDISILDSDRNEYYTGKNYLYVQHTDNFKPNTKQELLNIYYTVLDSGLDDFEFYCPSDYESCINDVKDISNDQNILSNINNFVHPFNSFKNIETEYDSVGKVTFHVSYSYDENKIIEINTKVDEIIKKDINSDLDIKDKIKLVHDYIVNNTVYDKERSDNNIVSFESDSAYGVLLQGHAICGGYADAVAIFMDRFNIENYKVASENHVWNLIKVNDKWLHLDATWDDPITTSGNNVIEYTFYLIDTNSLLEIKTGQHDFDPNVYKEAYL